MDQMTPSTIKSSKFALFIIYIRVENETKNVENKTLACDILVIWCLSDAA